MGETALGGALLVLLLWAAALCCYDLAFRRLPDGLTLPPAAAALLSIGMLNPVLLPAGLTWSALYLLLGMAGGGVGGGDIKLALSLGLLLAVLGGAGAVLAAATLAGLLSVLAALALRSPAVAHGPAMLWATAGVGAGIGFL